jgi:cytochrome c oxidase assembly factor CtaG
MAVLDSAYHGPPQLTLPRAFTEWTADPTMIALIVVLGAAYLSGVYWVRRRGGEWKTGRSVAFCGLGLGFLVIATMSWVGVYYGILFYARATQTVLLVLLAPLFLAMGKPITLFAEVFPSAGASVVKIIRSRVAKVVTFPAVTSLALVGIPMIMYFTSWYTATFHSGTARELTYLALMAPGYLFFWTLLRVDPVPKEYPYGVGMWITAAEVVGDAFFGLAIIADTNLIAGPYYHAVGWPYGPTLATNQVLGGGIIWILGDAVGLPFLAVQLIQMMRADKAEAAAIDAELDAKDAARAAGKRARQAERAARAAWRSGEEYAPVSASGTVANATVANGTVADATVADGAVVKGAVADGAHADHAGEDEERPWWEDDPRFTERFRKA